MTSEDLLSIIEKSYFSHDITNIKFGEISKKVGIERTSLYYYFKNKEDLNMKLLEYSYKKYSKSFNEVTKKNDLKTFIEWLIFYPLDKKNIFGVFYFKEWFEDGGVKKYVRIKSEEITNKIIKYAKENYINSDQKLYILNCAVNELCRSFDFNHEWTDNERNSFIEEVCKLVNV